MPPLVSPTIPDDEATIATLRGMLADRPAALAASAAEHWAIRGAEGNTDPVRAATAARRLRIIAV